MKQLFCISLSVPAHVNIIQLLIKSPAFCWACRIESRVHTAIREILWKYLFNQYKCTLYTSCRITCLRRQLVCPCGLRMRIGSIESSQEGRSLKHDCPTFLGLHFKLYMHLSRDATRRVSNQQCAVPRNLARNVCIHITRCKTVLSLATRHKPQTISPTKCSWDSHQQMHPVVIVSPSRPPQETRGTFRASLEDIVSNIAQRTILL